MSQFVVLYDKPSSGKILPIHKQAYGRSISILSYQFVLDCIQNSQRLGREDYKVSLNGLESRLTRNIPNQKIHFRKVRCMTTEINLRSRARRSNEMKKKKPFKVIKNIATYYALLKRNEIQMKKGSKLTQGECALGPHMTAWKNLPTFHPVKVSVRKMHMKYLRVCSRNGLL